MYLLFYVLILEFLIFAPFRRCFLIFFDKSQSKFKAKSKKSETVFRNLLGGTHMDAEKIIQDLNRRFAKPLPEFYKRRIVVYVVY